MASYDNLVESPKETLIPDPSQYTIHEVPKPQFPLIVFSENFFFSSKGFDPRSFNRWKRKNGFARPVNGMND
jgi:hypothetical protein